MENQLSDTLNLNGIELTNLIMMEASNEHITWYSY
jgi:hypothetical protein